MREKRVSQKKKMPLRTTEEVLHSKFHMDSLKIVTCGCGTDTIRNEVIKTSISEVKKNHKNGQKQLFSKIQKNATAHTRGGPTCQVSDV